VITGRGDSWSPKSIEELLGEKGASPFAPIRSSKRMAQGRQLKKMGVGGEQLPTLIDCLHHHNSIDK